MDDDGTRVKANLDPTTWAGAFDCSACGRKRLPRSFSKNMVLKRRKDESAAIKVPGMCAG